MIAGGLFELPQNKWGFIAAGVGDCKAFCFSIEGKEVRSRGSDEDEMMVLVWRRLRWTQR